jgi:hypothetical protein
MMAHLLDALERGQDIGHYGRLVFAMIARHFIPDDQVAAWLTKNPGFDERQAAGLIQQVQERGYSPPRRERILEWQTRQEFPICSSNDPGACNVYRNLPFPDGVYDRISEYHEEKATAERPA